MNPIVDLLDSFFTWLDDLAWRWTGGWHNETWRRTFRVLPKISPDNKLVWGLCWKRDKLIPLEYNDPLMTHRVVKIYAHKREMFKDKLKEGTK